MKSLPDLKNDSNFAYQAKYLLFFILSINNLCLDTHIHTYLLNILKKKKQQEQQNNDKQ